MGATPQNDDDDELYDDTDVTEDDFAEFDIDEDEEQVPKQVMFKQTDRFFIEDLPFYQHYRQDLKRERQTTTKSKMHQPSVK